MEKLRILIVDDNINNLVTLRALIEDNLDVEVIEAQSGLTALDLLMRQSVDLLILDVHMPDLDGFELTELIRKREKTAHIPIILLTAAYVSEKFKLRGFELGVEDYITKPINDQSLIRRIQVYLRPIQKERQFSSELERLIKERTAELEASNQKLSTTLSDLELVNKELRNFAHVVSHDLKAPLNVIIGYSNIVATDYEDVLGPDGLKYLQTIEDVSFKMAALISDILNYSKNVAKPIVREDVDLNKTLYDVVEFTKASENIVFNIATLPMVQADKTLMHQIFQNLISNAIKYNDKSQKLIEVNCETDDDFYLFSVSDNGIGIKEADREHIFTMFGTANQEKVKEQGTGVGLSLVKKLIERQGGQLGFESEYGKGSTFKFTLPK